jgi:hypothetical protein
MDGPNFEKLFTEMRCLNGSNAGDASIIVRYLRFYKGTEGYERYVAHYLPQLPEELAKEFKPVTETVETEVEAKPTEEKVTETVVAEVKKPVSKKLSPKK